MLPVTEGQNLAKSTWGAENVSSKDIVIPQLKLAQANSDICKEGSARPGEIIVSTTKEVVMPKGGKLSFFPILCIRSWIVQTPKPVGGGYPEFIRKEPITPDNDISQWRIEAFEDNRPVEWHKQLSYLVLLADKATSYPFFMDFNNTHRNAGMLIATTMHENGSKGLPGPARIIELSARLKTHNTNSWFVIEAQPGRAATEGELTICKKWYDLFAKVQLREVTEEEDNGLV